jgi:hypothetical protein
VIRIRKRECTNNKKREKNQQDSDDLHTSYSNVNHCIWKGVHQVQPQDAESHTNTHQQRD